MTFYWTFPNGGEDIWGIPLDDAWVELEAPSMLKAGQFMQAVCGLQGPTLDESQFAEIASEDLRRVEWDEVVQGPVGALLTRALRSVRGAIGGYERQDLFWKDVWEAIDCGGLS